MYADEIRQAIVEMNVPAQELTKEEVLEIQNAIELKYTTSTKSLWLW